MAAFPSMVRTRDGQLLLVFRRAPDSRWLLQAHYDADQLRDCCESPLETELYHWDAKSQLVSIHFDQVLCPLGNPVGLSVDGQSADQDASLLLLDSGDILLSSFSWYAMPPAFAGLATSWGGKSYGGPGNTGCSYLPWGSYVRLSSDSGKSFSERMYLPSLAGDTDLVPGLRSSHGGGCRGQMVLRGQELFLATYAQIPEIGPRHSAHLYMSEDGGQSFVPRSTIACSPNLALYEPSLCVLEDKTLMCWMRTDHPDDRMATVRSVDGGKTWSEVELHKSVGHPAHALVLKSGELFVSYGYRHQGFGVRARLLNRQGTALDDAAEIVLRSDGSCSDLGYPWAVELDNGEIVVCYYFTGEDGVRHIAYTRLRRSL